MRTTYNRSGVALDQQSTPKNQTNETTDQPGGAQDTINEIQIERYELHDGNSVSNDKLSAPADEKITIFKFGGDWDAQAKQLKAEFPELAAVDMKYVRGEENELLTKIGITIGKKRDDLIDLLKKGQKEKV